MSNSSNPYSFHQDSEFSYEFISVHSVRYSVYFTEWSGFIEDYHELEGTIRHFGFTVLDQPEDRLVPDARVGHTITAIVTHYFQKEPHGVILYFVDNQDGKQEGRRRKFDQWFRLANFGLEKLDGVTGKDPYKSHFAVIFSSNHPNRDLFNGIMGHYRLLEQTKP